MTTVIATKDRLISDTFITYEPSFTGAPKIWVARGCAWGGAGPAGALASFKQWTLGNGKKPKFKHDEDEDGEKEEAKLEILQLHPKNGLFLWINDDLPEKIEEPFYAIGGGGPYAVGAMSAGATPEQAIEISAKWNANTRLPAHVVKISDIPKPKRRGK